MSGRIKWAAHLGLLAAAAAVAVPMIVSAQATPWRAALTGANEVPATTSTATGTFTATLDEAAGTLTWSLSVPSITSATAAHIHTGAAGTSGGIVVNLFAAPASGPVNSINVSGTARAADVIGSLAGNFPGLVDAIKGGTAYVNVHTTANPGGEIRAQISQGAAPTASGTTPSGVPFTGQVPARGSIALLVTAAPTSPGALVASLRVGGCGVESLGVLEGGAWKLFIDGAPAAVNVAFPASLAATSAFFVRCRA